MCKINTQIKYVHFFLKKSHYYETLKAQQLQNKK